MAIQEPTLEQKSDGSEGAMSIEIDLDTGVTSEPTVDAPDAPAEPAPRPATLDLPAAPQAGDRPAWLPAKFKTAEEFAASYGELERKLGTPAAPAAQPAATAKPADAPAAPGAPLVSDAELEAYGREVVSTGDLSPASRAALAAKGFPKAMVDAHVQGFNALRAGIMDRAVAPFGGPDGYAKAAEWGRENLSDAEKAQYSADVNSGDEARVMYAVNGLKARMDAANPPQARILHGRRAPASAPGFTSMAQQEAAQRDPRYWSDKAYRDEVERMIEQSTGY